MQSNDASTQIYEHIHNVHYQLRVGKH